MNVTLRGRARDVVVGLLFMPLAIAVFCIGLGLLGVPHAFDVVAAILRVGWVGVFLFVGAGGVLALLVVIVAAFLP